jgi:hypothetical protein
MKQDNVLTDAAKLTEELAAMAVEYQSHFRAEDDGDGTHRKAMSEIGDRWDPEPSRVMVRRLEMVGRDEAAAAFDRLSTAVFRVVAALDVHWAMEEALDDINTDVAPLRDAALHELSCASETFSDQEGDVGDEKIQRIALLTDAAVLADNMFSLGLEYQSYREGCLPSADDEDPIEVHMKRVADDYDQLDPAPIIGKLELKGFAAAAVALDDLSEAAGSHIICGRGEDHADERQILDNLTAKRDKAIDALKIARWLTASRGAKATPTDLEGISFRYTSESQSAVR